MPSPFPGMDPYLEGDLWTTVHSQLAAEIARQLAPKIAPRYVARTEKRFVIAAPDDLEEAEISVYTDVDVNAAKVAAIRMPENIDGNAAGNSTRRKIDHRVPLSVSIMRMRSSSTDRSPSIPFTTIGKKQISATMMSFGMIP